MDSAPTNRKIAFVHGGIGINYIPIAKKLLNDNIFQEKISLIKRNLDVNLEVNNKINALHDTIENQLLSYTVNCCLYDHCIQTNILPNYHIGHSMGLYSCLYASGFYGFLSGAQIICKVYELLRWHFQNNEFLLGSIIGLDEKCILNLIRNSSCEICIDNGYDNFVICGKPAIITGILHKALDYGAIYANYIHSKLPYHTPVSQTARSRIENYLLSININFPYSNSNVYSLVNHMRINVDTCRKSIADMICSRIQFSYGVYFISKMLTNLFCEIGPANKISKLVRKINPEIEFI